MGDLQWRCPILFPAQPPPTCSPPAPGLAEGRDGTYLSAEVLLAVGESGTAAPFAVKWGTGDGGNCGRKKHGEETPVMSRDPRSVGGKRLF